MDLNPWLKGEPIAARDPSLAYLLSLSIKKHKAQVITAAVGLLLVAGIGLFALFMYQQWLEKSNTLERKNADLARKAERDAVKAEREAVMLRAQEQLISGTAMENDGKFGLAKKNYANAGAKFAALNVPTDDAEAHLNLLYLRHRPPLYYFEGHRTTEKGRGRIYAVAISPTDDSLAMTAGEEDGLGVVKIWNLLNGQEFAKHKTLPGERVVTARFTPDGTRILMSGWDSRLTMWDFKKDQATPFSTLNENVAGIAFSPDGKYVATGTFGGAFVRVREVPSGKEICSAEVQGVVRALAFGEKGLLCTGGSDGI